MNLNYILMTHGILKTSDGQSSTAPAPSPISNFTSLITNNSIKLSWKNPTDSNFLGVRIQRKIGALPNFATDGDTIFDGFATSYTDTNNLIAGSPYKYRAFAYGYENVINDNIYQQTSIDFVPSKVYTVIIDTTNSNPLTAVSYADDAVGMVAGSNNWDSVFPFNEIKPVMLKNGKVNYYLNPNNFGQKLDGTPVDIVNGADGDVMIQFPKVWTYIRKVGNLIYVSLSNKKVNDNFECLAHTKSGVEKDYCYVAAYPGTWISSKMRSISDGLPTLGGSRQQIRTAAQSNGAGYRLFSFYQLLLIQVLYLIKYKNLNSQVAVGKGAINNTGNLQINGTLNTSGMTFGNKDVGGQSVKLFGVENLWGAYYEMIDGISTANKNIYTANDNFNNDLIGYKNHGMSDLTLPSESGEYITNVSGSNSLGFFPVESPNDGTSSSYFCDFVWINDNGTLVLGGVWEGDSIGIFYVDMWDNVNLDTHSSTAGRLAYL